MTVILAQLFSEARSEEIDKICYLSLGRLGPKFTAVEFNLAEKMMIRVLAKAYKKGEEQVKREFKKIGDFGDVAYKNQKPPASLSACRGRAKTKNQRLSVSQVYDDLYDIAVESGEGSVERKIEKLSKLISALDSLSAKYIIRIPLNKLRLGFSDMTILDALSWMIAGDKSKRAEIEGSYNIRADVGQIAKIVKLKGSKSLKGLKVSLGTPIIPALCQRLPTAEKMIEKMGKVAVEPKYDGQRLQIHFSKKKTAIFTRNLDNVTQMFPDIVEALAKEVKGKSVILDGEVIGINSKTGRFLPFQETIKRKRKYQIKEMVKEIPLKVFCFDILYKDGRDLLKVPFSERRKILERVLSLGNAAIIVSPQIVTDNPQVIRDYHDEQIKKGLEGAVLKKWQSPYDPGKRGYTWVKFKQEKGKKGGGLADTLDCVVMGYYRGKGRRAIFGIGAFLVGIRKNENFLTISKIGTGLSDEQWRELKLKIKNEKLKIEEKPKEYIADKNLTPDVWITPGLVVEIEADNITKSPIHTAQYALRFPRLVRFRDDKSPDQASNLKEVKKLYRMQGKSTLCFLRLT
ncbi:ATP-dependent DNA ligase [Candidatus Microgenomates bacterium]|nr:ATP-dependent DNA ligase [Candidatus Microgenomates bacterium]